MTNSKASRAKFLSKEDPWRAGTLGCLVFIAIGYALYFAALWLPTPQWGRELMQWAASMVGALNTAAMVASVRSTDAFPAQVVILYCAYGWIVLTGWLLFAWSFNEQVIQAMTEVQKAQPEKKRLSKLKSLMLGPLVLLLLVFFWYAFFFRGMYSNSWRDTAFFSASIYSTTLLLLCSACLSAAICQIFITLRISFSEN